MAEKWVEELKNYGPTEMIICMCANKMDQVQGQTVDFQESTSFANKYPEISVFAEVSAKSNENVAQLFNKIAVDCINKKDRINTLVDRGTFRLGTVKRDNTIARDFNKGEKSGCC